MLRYDFFDWELEEENKYFMTFGIPKDLLDKLEFPDFYDSMGIDAVNNPYAQPSLNTKEWLKLENEFFSWFKEVKKILFSKDEIIVTPELEKNWWVDEEESNLWHEEYEEYMSLLEMCGVIESPPTLNEPYRGGKVENYNELITLAKMSIRGVPLLFFNNDNTIIRITDYLTIQIFFRNKDMMEKNKKRLINELNAQILI